ncbi:MAG: glycosyltransferase [Bacteroidota bacterium]|nr:glycosyltransferase [Bacteroidota bacterium]
MSKIKEVTVYTTGDSAKISTWSNVPFFFTKTLIAKGIKVNRVNISPVLLIEKIYNKSILLLLKKLNWNPTYNYFRTYIHFLYVRIIIKHSTRKYKNSDANIFMTFSFSSGRYRNKLSVLFHDWTYHHYFKYFEEREPDIFERACIKREDKQIKSSDLLLPLFPGIANYMNERYYEKNIKYLGNVINSEIKVDAAEIIEKKLQSQKLLFVGSEKYINAAKSLILAFEHLRKKNAEMELHFIGIESQDLEPLPKRVICHGYLDKGNENERNLYYQLFRDARLFINTSTKWGAFSATVEAMYFYIPVVIAPYNEFTKTFGHDIDFGSYCEKNESVLIAEKIAELMQKKDYTLLCNNAHNAVKGFTWDAYIDKVLEAIAKELQTK